MAAKPTPPLERSSPTPPAPTADPTSWHVDIIAYRRQHFAVAVNPNRYASALGELSLEVTHNGHQWRSISLLPEEAQRVIEALTAALAKDKL